jgi:serine/threonine protein kinase
MAPELIQQGYPVGRAVDWWASGVVLYEMLTKRWYVSPPIRSFRYSFSCPKGLSNTCVFVSSHSRETAIIRYSTIS